MSWIRNTKCPIDIALQNMWIIVEHLKLWQSVIIDRTN